MRYKNEKPDLIKRKRIPMCMCYTDNIYCFANIFQTLCLTVHLYKIYIIKMKNIIQWLPKQKPFENLTYPSMKTTYFVENSKSILLIKQKF